MFCLAGIQRAKTGQKSHGGDNVNKSIRCTIENCHYWHKGNYCNAEQILIAPDRFASETDHTMNALQASSYTPSSVDKCQQTCCKTFIEHGAADATHDGIKKTY